LRRHARQEGVEPLENLVKRDQQPAELVEALGGRLASRRGGVLEQIGERARAAARVRLSRAWVLRVLGPALGLRLGFGFCRGRRRFVRGRRLRDRRCGARRRNGTVGSQIRLDLSKLAIEFG
jgi:hypothetical protein